MAGNISLGVLTILFALFVTSSGRGHDVLIGNSVAVLAWAASSPPSLSGQRTGFT
jgi:hypothetical protein